MLLIIQTLKSIKDLVGLKEKAGVFFLLLSSMYREHPLITRDMYEVGYTRLKHACLQHVNIISASEAN
jgi:hypothetical protein